MCLQAKDKNILTGFILKKSIHGMYASLPVNNGSSHRIENHMGHSAAADKDAAVNFIAVANKINDKPSVFIKMPLFN